MRHHKFYTLLFFLFVITNTSIAEEKNSKKADSFPIKVSGKVADFLFNNILDNGEYIGCGGVTEMVGSVVVQGKDRYNIEEQGKCFVSILYDDRISGEVGQNTVEGRISVFYLKEPASRTVYPILKYGDVIRVEGLDKRISGYVYDLIIYDKDENTLFAHARTYISDIYVPVKDEINNRLYCELSFDIDKRTLKSSNFHPLRINKKVMNSMSNTRIMNYGGFYYMTNILTINNIRGTYLLRSKDLVNWEDIVLLNQPDKTGNHEECSIWIDKDGMLYYAVRGPLMKVGKYNLRTNKIINEIEIMSEATRPSITIFDGKVYLLCNSLKETPRGLKGSASFNGITTERAHRCLYRMDKDLSNIQMLEGTSSLGGNYGVIEAYQNQLLIFMNLNKNGVDASSSQSRNGVYIVGFKPELFDLSSDM